ncbi:MAG: YpdA family putative bacillithiol disulfide reductase [Bacteroidetes bacterium]|nr:YpdA family putative bacillithiol disulfide reductase [Bacteroidota bacterium]MBS1539026.1 YpdA family putative bacillithiol disulfide reductase [Bacteroidota bacterium]
MEGYDLIIIGAGPIGLACGIEAKKAKLDYAIIEKGCLVNSLYNYPMNMSFFSTSERLEIGDIPFVSINAKPTRVEALEYYRRVCLSWGLHILLYEEVKQAQLSTMGSFSVTTTKSKYSARAIVLALGFYDRPFLLNVPGEELPKVKHYYDEPHPYFKQKVAVIGAANSAVDAALETWRKGADVTLIVREPALSESVKYWAKPDIENRIKEGSIKAYFNSTVTKISATEIEIMTPQGTQKIPNDFVLAMTGYEPPFALMKSMGIQFQNDEFHTPVYNEKTMETNVSGLYLAGVVCGGLKTNKWFIENSRDHARLIIQDLKV